MQVFERDRTFFLLSTERLQTAAVQYVLNQESYAGTEAWRSAEFLQFFHHLGDCAGELHGGEHAGAGTDQVTEAFDAVFVNVGPDASFCPCRVLVQQQSATLEEPHRTDDAVRGELANEPHTAEDPFSVRETALLLFSRVDGRKVKVYSRRLENVLTTAYLLRCDQVRFELRESSDQVFAQSRIQL